MARLGSRLGANALKNFDLRTTIIIFSEYNNELKNLAII